MNLLISFGPLKAYIDDVRYITNNSSGIMGYEITKEALLRKKYKVKAVVGSGVLKPLKGLKDWIEVDNYAELKKAMDVEFQWADIIIMGAAVCDFAPQKRSGKIKRAAGDLNLRLKATSSIIGSLSRKRGRKEKFLAGFSLENESFISNALDKRARDKLDMTLAFYLDKIDSPYGDNACQSAVVSEDYVLKMPVFKKDRLAKYILDVIERELLSR
jgi:phosphopantothenoylcysteine decarboxylase / phosphopantothenate---cysteine ligase